MNFEHSLARHYARLFLAQLNSLTKYPSILTLHALGEKGRLTEEITTPAILEGELFATEKIDGTNVRLLVFADGSYIVGSRENLLHVCGDVLFDPAQGIVSGLQSGLLRQTGGAGGLIGELSYQSVPLTVIYGEFYGDKISAAGKHYAGSGQTHFRVFDIAVFASDAFLDALLHAPTPEIAAWREKETAMGMEYGQAFLGHHSLVSFCQERDLDMVPALPAPALEETGHRNVLDWLNQHIRTTKAPIGDWAAGQAEGVVLRTADRSAIVKARFQDYERTLK